MVNDNLLENKLEILGKITASLIHEIRNPLSAILLNLQYLRMIKQDFPSEIKESIQSCEAAAYRIQNLIENVSSFTRKNGEKNCSCSPNEVTEEALKIMHTIAIDKNINLVANLEPNIPRISIDRNKVLQIFLNLITNSIEACEKSGEIIISTYRDPETGNIIWEIEDNGVGICEEHKSLILTDFFTSKTKGTGLGLSVCQSILREHNCELTFESREGAGSRFSIHINPALISEANEV